MLVVIRILAHTGGPGEEVETVERVRRAIARPTTAHDEGVPPPEVLRLVTPPEGPHAPPDRPYEDTL